MKECSLALATSACHPDFRIAAARTDPNDRVLPDAPWRSLSAAAAAFFHLLPHCGFRRDELRLKKASLASWHSLWLVPGNRSRAGGYESRLAIVPVLRRQRQRIQNQIPAPLNSKAVAPGSGTSLMMV